MKKIFPGLCLLLSMILWVPVLAQGAEKNVTVVFTHDLHSRIESGALGGFARLKTAVDEVKETAPNALVVDAGDFSMGTLYQPVYDTEALELRLLGALGVDATTFGNHEFDYTTKGTVGMLEVAKASGDRLPAFLIPNIDWENSQGAYTDALQKALADYGAVKTLLLQKGEVTIGLFSLMGEDAVACAPTCGLSFTDTAAAAKTAVEALKAEGADLIVCLSHGGTNENPKKSEDELLAKAVPGIDLIISGHTHTTLDTPIRVGTTAIVSAGEYGKNLGVLSLSQKGEDWTISDYELKPMDETVTEDADMAAVIDGYRQKLGGYLAHFGYESPDQVIAYSPMTFPSLDDMSLLAEQPLGNLIADSYIYGVREAEGEHYVPVDVAVVPLGVIRDTISQGEITVSDVYEISSLGIGEDGLSGYPLVSVYLTGRELRTMAEVDASVSRIMGAAQLYCSGLGYRYNPNRMILNRVTDVWLETEDGKQPLEEDRLYRVITGLYSGQMLGAVESQSYGLLRIVPKNAAGEPVSDFAPYFIQSPAGEVKEWAALAAYLASFPKNKDGLPEIPVSYESLQGRKEMEDSRSPVAILKHPNKIAVMAGAILLALVIVVVAVVLLVRRKWKQRRKRHAHQGHH